MKANPFTIGALLFVTASITAFSQENLIVRENRNEGTTNWLLFNYHQVIAPGRDELWKREKGIEGYCSHTSIKAGETLKVFVSTEPATPFKIDFFRMGYYGGTGGRLMLSTGTIAGKTQPTPEDGKKMLIECKWDASYDLKIPQDWPSGVYLGKLQVATPKAEAYVIFIVRDERKADLLFQCSDMTWQSYNRWPAWRSLYDYQTNRWHTDAGNDVGFDRPYGIYLNWLPVNYFPISNGSGEFLLWEFPLAFWLEKGGYDVSYISNIDTHTDREGLLRAKGWLSVGHDEYWTQQMYDNVVYARDHGVSLAFLSGNSVSGIVYLNPSTAGRPNRVFGRIQRFGQAARDLMGSSSHGTGMADWTVEKPDHWIFDGTGMKKGDGIPKLVGWEYHGVPNGNQPGLTILATAPTRPRDNRDLDTRNPHTSTIYELPKGNIVFDAGTCWWNMVLSTPPGEMNPPRRDFSKDDPRVQRITANLLRRMIEGKSVNVARWDMHEFSATGRPRVANPFRESALVGEFVSPSGRTNVIDGFYDGEESWRLRFAPDVEGEWSYLLRGEGVEILQKGKLRCTAPRGHGFIRIHPENPHAFALADGTPFFPMGDTCYGLFDDSPITPELRAEYLKTRRAQRFNFVRMTIGHSEARAATNSSYWAWGGTAQKPDLDRFNPEFFRGFDVLMRQLRDSGMNVELIVLNFYRRPFTDTNSWTPARERLWLRYVVSRYAAFDNVFLWTVANEYETHPDGRYRLDFPGDVEWAEATARFIKANDPYQHLVTVHAVISTSRRGESPRAPFDPPWRIGEFFGAADAMDVLSQQTGGSGDGAVWDEKLQCWTGDSSTLVASLGADRRFRKPVLNTEFGYEYLRGHATEKQQVHHTDKVRRSAWRIVCSGGYFAAGFHGTIGHSDVWNRIDAPNHYTFTDKDEGAAAQLGALQGFFTALPFWRMEPFSGVTGDAVALAEPGKIYAIYLPHGGAAAVDLSAAQGSLTARWFNPRAGHFGEPMQIAPTNLRDFRAQDTNDWALLVSSTMPP